VVEGLVKNEELQLWTEIGGIGDLGFFEEVGRLAGDGTRVARVFAFGNRIADVADDRQRCVLQERIDLRGAGDGHQKHVGLIDGLPPAYGTAIKAKALLEAVQRQLAQGCRSVLPQPRKIHESKIDKLDLLFLTELQNVFGGHHLKSPE